VTDARQIQQCGVYVFAYRSTIFSGTYRLGDVVDALKEQMRLDKIFDCHTIIFVAHSMGGIVARKLIVSRMADFQARGIRIGLFLVASPSLGSHYANLLEPLARAMNHTHADALCFSQTNSWLMDLDREFINLKESDTLELIGKELIEDQFLFLKGLIRRQVVEPPSGAKYFGEAIKIPGSDHSSIAKPESAEALQHRLLIDFIDKIVGGNKRLIESELIELVRGSQPDQPSNAAIAPTLDSAATRRLVAEAFSDEEIGEVAFDRFPAVFAQFAAGMSRSQKIQRLVEFAARQRMLSVLQEEVRERNPGAYAALVSPGHGPTTSSDR
jgi:pimeloyl-ACP methyl ester carboxylesterase